MDQYVIFCNPLVVLGRYRLEFWTSGKGIAIDKKLLGYRESLITTRDHIPSEYRKRDRFSSDDPGVIEVWVNEKKG